MHTLTPGGLPSATPGAVILIAGMQTGVALGLLLNTHRGSQKLHFFSSPIVAPALLFQDTGEFNH